MEYNKFHLISFILQISDLDITFQDLYFLHVTLMTGKKLHLNTLLTKSYDEMPSVKCRPSSRSKTRVLIIRDTENSETISQQVLYI